MKARIFKPAKNAMQSGKAKTGEWQLEFEPQTARSIDPLMGYTTSSDMASQIKLAFETKQEAIAYCEKRGLAFQVSEPRQAKRRKIAYSDNFATNRVLPWTH